MGILGFVSEIQFDSKVTLETKPMFNIIFLYKNSIKKWF